MTVIITNETEEEGEEEEKESKPWVTHAKRSFHARCYYNLFMSFVSLAQPTTTQGKCSIAFI